MTSPASENNPIIDAFNRLIEVQLANGEDIKSLARAVDSETAAVKEEAAARDRKVDTLRRTNVILVIIVALLLGFAAFNAYGISQNSKTAQASQDTNKLLLGCLQPHTTCSDANVKSTAQTLNQIRQTQFVIAVCQRQNPLPPNATPVQIETGTKKLVACVDVYYPDFSLPAKAK